MSDDISIPMTAAGRAPFTHSYRTRRTGMDAGTKRLLIAAGALGALLLAGMAGWAVVARHPAGVPVIEADSRPLRVKPDNPGGMQVAGADEQVMGGSGNGGAETMAPAAEAPAPQALRAQMQPAAPATPPPAQAQPPAPAAIASPPTTAPVARATPAPVPAPRPAAVGGTLVQLAALDTEAAAQAEWQRLAKRMPDVLGDKRLVMQKADRDGKPIWRVRTGGFTDIAEATSFCTRVRAKGGACSIASF